MAVTFSEYQQYLRDAIASGYISGFTNGALGTLDLAQTAAGSGSLSGQSVIIKPKGRYITAPSVISGLVTRADGSIFNPWGLAGKRAPTAYPQHTQVFLYIGNTAITMQYYEKLLGRVGLTGDLIFSYGRTNGDTFDEKTCEAMLLTVSAPAERIMADSSSVKAAIEFSATWQQTGAFTW